MRVIHVTHAWLHIAGATLVAAAIIWLIARSCLHLQLLAVQTGSMRPTFNPGDALIIQHRKPADVQVGQIVSYHSARNPRELITHRVVNIDAKTGSFQTKGDRLASPDPAVRDSLLAGRVVAILPGLGAVFGWFRTIPGLVVCVYLPALAIAVSELRRLEHHYARFRRYRLHPRQVI